MDAPLAVATVVEKLGALVMVLAAAGAVALPRPRWRAAALVTAVAVAPWLLIEAVRDVREVRDALDGAGLAAGALGSLALMGALAVLILGRTHLLPPLAVAALPFRVPIEVGGQSANLLVPLYLVIGGGCLAYAWRNLRMRSPSAGDESEPGPAPPWLRRIEVILAASVVIYALQALYSTDFDQALRNLVFFYVPFLLLLRLLVDVRWTRAVAMACLGVAVGLAVAFAAVGFYEYATRRVLLNPNAAAASQFQSFFRVNSLFFDPNAYGQFLAIVMLALATLVLWGRQRRTVLLATLALAVLWAALVLTFSQSSFAALLAGLIVLAALRWSGRLVGAVLGILAVAALAAVLAAPGAVGVDLTSDDRLNDATSGRVRLITGGLEMFADRPLWGFGSGSFSERFRRRERVGEFGASVSHTTPITVAAEQGAVGLVSYALVLLSAGLLMFRGLGALRLPGHPDHRLVARAAAGAGAVALTVHTMFYGGFLESPLTWTLVAAALALRSPEPAPGVELEQMEPRLAIRPGVAHSA